jgi:hypothetical protein
VRFATAIFAFMALSIWVHANGTSAGEPAPSSVEVATCAESVGGSPNEDWREDATTAGPFGLLGPGRRFRFMREWSNGNFTAKVPAILEGHEAATLRVRAGARDRIRLDYGDFDTEREIPNTPTEILFEPCADKSGTGWPGGILITTRRPASLVVEVGGQERRRSLRVGPGASRTKG